MAKTVLSVSWMFFGGLASLLLTDVKAVGNALNCDWCELRTDETEEPICCCCCSSALRSHGDGVDFRLIYPWNHAPGAAKCGVVKEQECDADCA